MSHRPVQLILDFDGTLTRKDTLHLVAEAGYTRQKTKQGARGLPPWQEIVDAYLADYDAYASTYQPERSARTTITSEATWLDSLQDVEDASARRVVTAGIFDDLRMQDMEHAATDALRESQVLLRPGWAHLMVKSHQMYQSSGSESASPELIQIVSVNWSRWFVWNVLWKAASSLHEQELAGQVTEILRKTAVYANEVPSINTEINSTPVLSSSPLGHEMTLRTAGDKLRHMQTKTASSVSQTPLFKIYVGDSATDLECLLMADVGICMRDENISSGQQELELTCERIGIRVRSLSEYKANHKTPCTLKELEELSKQESTILYFAHDFYEIEQWLTNLTRNHPGTTSELP